MELDIMILAIIKNLKLKKEKVIAENMIKMEKLNMKVNIQMVKRMEKEKNMKKMVK